MEKTNYGMKKEGKSRFIIVAPHAAVFGIVRKIKDDINTGKLSKKIAKKLNAFLVINEKYIKPTNSKIRFIPNVLREDFNILSWDKRSEKHNWDRERKPMKEFYEDVSDFIKIVHNDKYNDKVVVIFIHGTRDGILEIGDNNIEIDIGCGGKYYKGRLVGAKEHPEARTETGINTGELRVEPEDMETFKKELEKHGIKVGIGEAIRINKKTGKQKIFAAWSRTNGVQFIENPDYSFQLEIARKWRKWWKLEYTSKIIAEALKLVYN